MKKAWRNPWRVFHRDQRGQAIFLGLFYFLLLAALVFLVLNSGGRANDKIQLQNTADAVAATGADWFARGLNTISMCNVTQTQLMSTIVMLDSIETVAPVSQRIIDDLLAHIGNSAHGGDVPNDPQLKDWLIVNNAMQEQQMMRRMNDLIRSIPMSQYCDYDSGILWQCCYVLNELKTQVATAVPDVAQREAIHVALINLDPDTDPDVADHEAGGGFVLPYHPALPIEPIDNTGASFYKFKRPMYDATDPYSASGRTNRWRRWGRRRGTIGGYRYLQGYVSRRSGQTLGPFLYFREPFVEPTPMGLFELSRFSVLLRVVSDAKFEMLFGAPNAKVCLAEESRIEDYDKLKDFVAKNGDDKVLKTYWTTQGFDSRYAYNTVEFKTNLSLRNPQYPRERLRVFDGFRDVPDGFTRATTMGEGADPRHDLFYRSQERKTANYHQLGIIPPHPPRYDDGSPWPYTEAEMQIYYHTALWRFDGADIGPEVELDRRYLPPVGQPPRMAPILLSRTTGTNTTENVFNNFSFVGLAFKRGESLAWPEVFVNSVPTDEMIIAYAQCQVYNEFGPNDRRSGWNTFS